MNVNEPCKQNGRQKVIVFYFFRFGYRLALLAAATIAYIYAQLHPDKPGLTKNLTVNLIAWAICVFGILRRFFPSRLESMGCDKLFAKNYNPREERLPQKSSPNQGLVLTLILWVLLNSVFGVLYLTDVINTGAMILLCCIYGVCDYICILFYCPFQSLLMKNRCCVTCRIFEWDYAMLFTPLIFVEGIWFRSLFILSLLLTAKWEITYHMHPERFLEETNQNLSCANCTEQLCRYKHRAKGRNNQ